MGKSHISYVGPATVNDLAMSAEFQRSAREGTPRPESLTIRNHVPIVFWSFANSWRDVFKNGVADHDIKELCHVYVSCSVECEYCGPGAPRRRRCRPRSGVAPYSGTLCPFNDRHQT